MLSAESKTRAVTPSGRISYARIDRKRKLPITTLLRALPADDPTTGYQLDTSSNEKILELFGAKRFIETSNANYAQIEQVGRSAELIVADARR